MKTTVPSTIARRTSGLVFGLVVFAAAILPLAEAAARIIL